jgi:hypothetical protein
MTIRFKVNLRLKDEESHYTSYTQQKQASKFKRVKNKYFTVSFYQNVAKVLETEISQRISIGSLQNYTIDLDWFSFSFHLGKNSSKYLGG